MDVDSKIPQNSIINDIRSPTQFKGITFSKYKKTDVRNQLIENMKSGKIENSLYWSAEFICAGHFMDIWEIILNYVGKHIHLGNPKMVIYLQMRFEMFKNIISKGQYLSEIDLRNDLKMRKLFAEIISALTLSNRKHSFEPIRINREEEFDMTQMTERFKAPSVHYADGLLKKEDPKEFFIAVNEFAYHISPDSKSTINACYWIEWMIDFDTICRKRKEPCLCEKRNKVPVEGKYQRDNIWLLWDVIEYYISNVYKMDNNYIYKLFNAVYQLFCIKYTTASCKKRRYLLYFAVALLTEDVPNNIELMPHKQMVQTAIGKINDIYKQIKTNGLNVGCEQNKIIDNIETLELKVYQILFYLILKEI